MENITIDEFRNFSFLSGLKYSPNKAASAIVATKANDENGYYKAIFVSKGAGYFQLTRTDGNVGINEWLDDGHILFSETRNKDVQKKIDDGHEITSFHKISINGGEAQKLFDVDATVLKVFPLKNGTFILSAQYDNNRPSLDEKTESEKQDALKEFKKEKDYEVIDELPYWFNGAGFTNKKRTVLYHYDSEKLTLLTNHLDDIDEFKVSPDEQFILFSGVCKPYDVKPLKANLHLLNIQTKEVKTLLEDDLFISDFDFYGDNYFLAASSGEKYSYHEHPSFYVLSDKGRLDKLCDFDRSLFSTGNSDCKLGSGRCAKLVGDKYFFLSLDGYRSDVYKLCLKSGNIVNVTNSGGNIDFFDVSDEKILYVAVKNLDLQEVYLFDNGNTTKVSEFNVSALEGKSLSSPIHHKVKISENLEIDGWVIKPVDFERGKKYPTILNIHGGPKTAYVDCYFHEMQYWANCGYFVIFCNPRGSDGYGNEFADIRGLYGTIDYDDIMKFTDDMCEIYREIDEARLGVTGGSYGGYE